MLSRMHHLRLFPSSILLALGLALCGCAMPPDQGHTVDGVVMVAPPQPQVDVIPAPPQPGYVWIGGYWNWVGGRHEWVPGHWEAPRRGYRWEPHHWVRERDGWHLHGGHWVR